MKERGKDKVSITQGHYLALTRQSQLLTYLVGASGVWGVAAFQRSKGEENVFADTWEECVPARMGFWDVTARSPLQKFHGGYICLTKRVGPAKVGRSHVAKGSKEMSNVVVRARSQKRGCCLGDLRGSVLQTPRMLQ